MRKVSPRILKLMLNFYPPYIGAGVKVKSIRQDWSEMTVSMKLKWYNKNAYGTHFGGNLYSMVDPHLVLLLIHKLGKDYVIWDKSASIDFLKPGTGEVTCTIKVSQNEVEDIRLQTVGGRAFHPKFNLEIVDTKGEVVAKVGKILYVRRKSLS